MSPTHFRPSAPKPGNLDPTKRLIVATALSHFGRYGIEGATLSQMREAAGQSNRSAIHYHFGGKEGLLYAVIEHIESRLMLCFRDSIARCEQQLTDGTLTVESLAEAIGKPFSTVCAQNEEGLNCMRVLSHLTHETDTERVAMASDLITPLALGMLKFLQSLMPGLTAVEYSAVLFLCITHHIEMASVSPMFQQSMICPQTNGTSAKMVDMRKMSDRFVSAGLASVTASVSA